MPALPPDLPEELRPRLLVFLSADVVGSTALKQPNRTAKSGEEAVDWLLIFDEFYQTARRALRRHWGDLVFRQEDATAVAHNLGPAPVFWKTVGDEVIFYKELQDSRQIHGVLEAWLLTIDSIRAFFRTHNDVLNKTGQDVLDLKSTVWTAGFPRKNKQVRVIPATGKDIMQELPTEEAFDFIGPNIDIGFRLASYSSHQKMVVSMDVAYMLSLTMADETVASRSKEVFYDGRVFMKRRLQRQEISGILDRYIAGGQFRADRSVCPESHQRKERPHDVHDILQRTLFRLHSYTLYLERSRAQAEQATGYIYRLAD